MADEGVNMETGAYLSPKERAVLELRLALKLSRIVLSLDEVLEIVQHEHLIADGHRFALQLLIDGLRARPKVFGQPQEYGGII